MNMKATKLTKKELETIAQLNAQAEERRRMAEDEKRRAELKKKYERSERQRAYYGAHKEQVAAYQKAYREKNKEKIAAYQKAYRAAAKLSPEERAAAAVKHEAEVAAKRAARAKQQKERQRAYYLENRERILARNTEYRRRMKAEKAAASPAA